MKTGGTSIVAERALWLPRFWFLLLAWPDAIDNYFCCRSTGSFFRKISKSDGAFFILMSSRAKRIALAIRISSDVRNFILLMRTSGSRNSLLCRILSHEEPVVLCYLWAWLTIDLSSKLDLQLLTFSTCELTCYCKIELLLLAEGFLYWFCWLWFSEELVPFAPIPVQFLRPLVSVLPVSLRKVDGVRYTYCSSSEMTSKLSNLLLFGSSKASVFSLPNKSSFG